MAKDVRCALPSESIQMCPRKAVRCSEPNRYRDSVCSMRWSRAVSGGLALTNLVRSRPDSTGVPRESTILPATTYQELAALPGAHSAAKISDALPRSSGRVRNKPRSLSYNPTHCRCERLEIEAQR